MDKDAFEHSIVYSEIPLEAEGTMYDLFTIDEKFFPNRGRKVADIKLRGEPIRGLVIENDIPKEGSQFKIHYTSLFGVMQFGILYLEGCRAIVKEGELIYFEGGPCNSKYVLRSAKVN